MYMHLSWYEPSLLARVALHVRELPPDVAGAYRALRGSDTSAWAAGYAAHHPASAVACRRGVSGTTGRNAGDGQHKLDSNPGNHAPAGLDRRAPRRRPARTMAASVQERRSTTQACSACLGESAIAPARSAGGAGLEQSSATHLSSNGPSHNSRRLAMKNYGKLITGIIIIWLIFALSASALHAFKNDANRVGVEVAIAAVTPIVVFSLWIAVSEKFRQFALSSNPRTLTSF